MANKEKNKNHKNSKTNRKKNNSKEKTNNNKNHKEIEKIVRRSTPYSEVYKRQIQKIFEEKARKLKPILQPKQIPQPKPLEEKTKIEKEVEKEYQAVKKFIKEPKHVKIIKFIFILVPIIILFYILAANFLVSREFTYFYDIGSEKDNYLSPVSRISDKIADGDINYRNLIDALVYFNAEIPRNSETIKVQAKVKDNFPNNTKFSIGAKDKEEWHYKWNPVYNPILLELNKFENINNVYRINSNLPLLSIEQLKNKENIIIATDGEFLVMSNSVDDFAEEETLINTSLRGGHIFYVYLKDNIALDVKKQDINWYNGSDELSISLYDLNENLITNITIPDDGTTDNSHKENLVQKGKLTAENLKEGIYKLEFSDFDGLIREIKINTNKIIIANKIYLADNDIFFKNLTKPSSVYINSIKPSDIEFRTWHKQGFQNIKINSDIIQIAQTHNATIYRLNIGEYIINASVNDIIINYAGYFAFSKESYFEPFKQRIIPIPNDINYLTNNVDYLITDYINPIKDGNWIITETSFNIQKDNLYIKDNKLSMVLNIPHLSQDEYKNYTIPIDWIKITVYKPGLIEK